jgi:hypothetical protein
MPKHRDYVTIDADALRAAIKDSGLSVTEVARRAKTTRAKINHLLDGTNSTCDANLRDRLRRVLFTTNAFLEGEAARPPRVPALLWQMFCEAMGTAVGPGEMGPPDINPRVGMLALRLVQDLYPVQYIFTGELARQHEYLLVQQGLDEMRGLLNVHLWRAMFRDDYQISVHTTNDPEATEFAEAMERVVRLVAAPFLRGDMQVGATALQNTRWMRDIALAGRARAQLEAVHVSDGETPAACLAPVLEECLRRLAALGAPRRRR